MSLWLADLAVNELIDLHKNYTSNRMPGFNRLPRHIRDTVTKLKLSA